jgi:hypothetical protein
MEVIIFFIKALYFINFNKRLLKKKKFKIIIIKKKKK